MVPDYPDSRKDILPLEQVIEIGHKHGVPIIVDAAGQTYPSELLSRFAKLGADLCATQQSTSRGSKLSGWVCGRKESRRSRFAPQFHRAGSGDYDSRTRILQEHWKRLQTRPTGDRGYASRPKEVGLDGSPKGTSRASIEKNWEFEKSFD